MYSATITSKRQITIPAEVFRALGLKTGDQLTISFDENRKIQMHRDIDIVAQLKKMNFSNTKIKTPKNKSIDEVINESTEKHYPKTDEN